MQQQAVATKQVDASRLGELKEVVASALSEAHSSGASQAEADVSLQRGLTVTVRLGEVDTIEYHRDRGLSVTVYFGKSKGSASTADLRPSAVHATVVKASAIAQHTAADECAGLADPAALAREIPDLDLYHAWDIEPERLRAFVIDNLARIDIRKVDKVAFVDLLTRCPECGKRREAA